MIAIYGKVSTTGGKLCINDVVTNLTVIGNLPGRTTYDKETEYTFVYGHIYEENIYLFAEMKWDNDTVTLLPVPNSQSLYVEGSATVKTIGESEEYRIVMVTPIQAKRVGIGRDDNVVIHNLQTCMSDYHRGGRLPLMELVV